VRRQKLINITVMKKSYFYLLLATVTLIIVAIFIQYNQNGQHYTDSLLSKSDTSISASNSPNGSEYFQKSKIPDKHHTPEITSDFKGKKTVSLMLYEKFYDKKKSEQLFIWLKKNGLNHPDAIKKLRDLRRSGGGWIYSIELINMLSNNDVTDINTSLILKIITDAYQGGSYADGDFSTPKNNKDSQIQDFLRQQLEVPKGKASFYEALRNADIIDQGDSLYEFIEEVLDKNHNLLNETAIYKYKLKYSHNLPEQLQHNLKFINSLPQEKQTELASLIYDSIDSFSDNPLVVMTEETKEQYQNFLDKNKVDVPIYIDGDTEEELTFETVAEMNDWLSKNQEADNQYQQKTQLFIERLNAKIKLDMVTDKQEYLYQYALNTESIAESIAILQYQVEEASLDDNNESFSKFSNSHELKYKLESGLSDPSLTPSQQKEIKLALETYFDI